MQSDLPLYIVIGVLVAAGLIVLSYYFYRYVFSIEKQLKNQQQQTALLLKIAEAVSKNPDDGELEAIRRNILTDNGTIY